MPKHLGQANTGMCCVDISVPRRSAVVASAPGRSTVVVTCSSRRGTHCHIVATKGSAYYRSTGRRLVATSAPRCPAVIASTPGRSTVVVATSRRLVVVVACPSRRDNYCCTVGDVRSRH